MFFLTIYEYMKELADTPPVKIRKTSGDQCMGERCSLLSPCKRVREGTKVRKDISEIYSLLSSSHRVIRAE